MDNLPTILRDWDNSATLLFSSSNQEAQQRQQHEDLKPDMIVGVNDQQQLEKLSFSAQQERQRWRENSMQDYYPQPQSNQHYTYHPPAANFGPYMGEHPIYFDSSTNTTTPSPPPALATNSTTSAAAAAVTTAPTTTNNEGMNLSFNTNIFAFSPLNDHHPPSSMHSCMDLNVSMNTRTTDAPLPDVQSTSLPQQLPYFQHQHHYQQASHLPSTTPQQRHVVSRSRSHQELQYHQRQIQHQRQQVLHSGGILPAANADSGESQKGHPPSQRPIRKRRRPPYSCATLIAQAILTSKHQRLTLREIYHWIQTQFPNLYEENEVSWQNTIRHNLSLNKCFTKLPRLENDKECNAVKTKGNKGGYWTVDLQQLNDMKIVKNLKFM